MKRTLVLAAVLAATALPAAAAAKESLRTVDAPSAPERYVPFVTDFPTTAAPPARVDTTGGFDGLDAALGAAVGLALGALGAASVPALRSRRRVASA